MLFFLAEAVVLYWTSPKKRSCATCRFGFNRSEGQGIFICTLGDTGRLIETMKADVYRFPERRRGLD